MVLLSKNKKRKGFTLIELLVIIGIIGTIVLIAGWQYKKTLTSQKLTNEAIKISSILQEERYRSIEKGTLRGIEFKAPDSLLIFTVDSEGNVNYERVERLGKDFQFGSSGITVRLPLVDITPEADGIMFSGNRCIFKPTGMAFEKGAVIITGKFGTASVIVSPTGIVKPYKFINGQWAEVR